MTNAKFLIDLLQTPEFAGAKMHTGMIDQWAEESAPILARPVPAPETVALAAAILAGPDQKFRNRGEAQYAMTLETAGGAVSLLMKTDRAAIAVFQGETKTKIRIFSVDGAKIRFERDGVLGHATALRAGATLHLSADGMVNVFTEPSPFAAAEPKADPSRIIAPVSGTLLSILPEGSAVVAGDIVAVIEAMKIETRIEAAAGGTVAQVHAAAGAQVSAKMLLAEMTLQTEEAP
jgi:geranyl-CoA carboxylase alpha subunit